MYSLVLIINYCYITHNNKGAICLLSLTIKYNQDNMYLFYVDESGTESLNEKYISDNNNRFYILTATAIYEHQWKALERDLNDFKKELFPGISLDEVEVHMNVLKQPRSISKHQYFSTLSDVQVKGLIDCYFSKICDGKATLFSIIIDKQYFNGLPKDVINKSHELLIERIENYLREYHSKHNGLIIYDEKNKQNMQALSLLQQNVINKRRTSAITINHIIELPFFVKSEFSNGIQLTDMCAYSINKAFSRNDFNYEDFRRILPSFYRSNQSQKKKYDGIKVFPSKSPFSKWENWLI